MKMKQKISWVNIGVLVITMLLGSSSIVSGQQKIEKMYNPGNLGTETIRAISVNPTNNKKFKIVVGTDSGKIKISDDLNLKNLDQIPFFDDKGDLQTLIRDIYYKDGNAYLLESEGIHSLNSDGIVSNQLVSIDNLPKNGDVTPRLFTMSVIGSKVCVGGIYTKDGNIDSPLILCTDNFRSTNTGWNMSTNLDKTPVQIISINFVDEKNGWAVGTGGTILFTEDGGRSWTKQSEGLNITEPLMSVFGFTNLKAWAVGYKGQIWFKKEKEQTSSQHVPVDNGDTGAIYRPNDRIIIKPEILQKIFTVGILQNLEIKPPQLKGIIQSVNSRTRKLKVKLETELTEEYQLLKKYILKNEVDFEDVEKDTQQPQNSGSGTTTSRNNKVKDWEDLKMKIPVLKNDKEILRNIKFASTDENEQFGWIVGDKGRIFYTDNGGKEWKIVQRIGLTDEQQKALSKTNFYSIFVDNGYCWIGGSNGTIVRIKYKN